MKNQTEAEPTQPAMIFSSPTLSNGETIYLNDRRGEELDPVDIPVPDEENKDPKKIEPIGNYGNNESPSNVDESDYDKDRSDVDIEEDDEDSLHPDKPPAL